MTVKDFHVHDIIASQNVTCFFKYTNQAGFKRVVLHEEIGYNSAGTRAHPESLRADGVFDDLFCFLPVVSLFFLVSFDFYHIS
jgi:hypothetical protein